MMENYSKERAQAEPLLVVIVKMKYFTSKKRKKKTWFHFNVEFLGFLEWFTFPVVKKVDICFVASNCLSSFESNMKKVWRLRRILLFLVFASTSIIVLLETFQVEVKLLKIINLQDSFHLKFQKNSSFPVPRFPDEDKIIIENKFWQVLHTSNGTFKLFNAYYDQRILFKKTPIVRILAFINRVDPVIETFCQLWFDGILTPFIVKVSEYKLIWQKEWGMNTIGSQPHLITCSNPLAKHGQIPSSVSLVENAFDDANNNLKVINNSPESKTKKPFAVCVKNLDFMDDTSFQVIEWIETLSLLGADKIFIYVIKIHTNLMRTLRYYEALGKVVVEMIDDPKGLPNRDESLQQWLQKDLISLNDCLYKHMNEYDYLIPLDTDEIIVPSRREDKTWMDMLQRTVSKLINEEQHAAYSVRNVFFLFDNNHEGEVQPEIPSHLTYLQHVYRAKKFSDRGVGIKSFQSTELVLSMHNHFPMERINQEFVDFSYIDIEDGRLQHYRRGCENYLKDECRNFKENTVKDLTLWNWKEEIIAGVNKTINELNALKYEFLD